MKKEIMETIQQEKPTIALVERPWGSFKQFANNQTCTVSLMTVLPGQRLSLQAHSNRAELWVVIDDGAVVQVGEDQRVCQAGDEIWIPRNQKHRLGSCKNKPVRVLEVAFGNWRQEDIKRYADDYRRPEAET